TFSLVAIAITLLRERPWWAMVAAAIASTQNPPIALLTGFIFLAALITRPRLISDRRFLGGTAIALAIALIHPAYSYWRHGTLSLLLQATRPGQPTFAELSAIVVDPSMGLIGNAPLWLVLVGLATVTLARRSWRSLLAADVVVALLSAVVFIVSCARTTNLHHGGTPSISRYALWLIPLAIPVLAHLHQLASISPASSATAPVGVRRRQWPGALRFGAVASAITCVFAFHPAVPAGGREPTWLATTLWTKFPTWNNPLPEVFLDTELHAESPFVPVTAGACDKILLGGSNLNEGLWPVPCYPEPVPAWCRSGAGCYANRRGDHYEFARTPGRPYLGLTLKREWVWPAEAEPHVRALFDEWNWSRLGVKPDGFDILRQGHGVHVSTLGNGERFIMVLQDVEPGSFLRLRPDGAMSGALIDPRTGQVLRPLRFTGPALQADGQMDDLWTVELPGDVPLLIMTMRKEPVR
ncbi:MAG: hypothetical protein ABI652_07680, partial [Acidobacteriota bacterium]